VKHLHIRLGTTSVFVTHDQEEAMTLSDLIAVMRDGHLVQFGTQHEVYRRPANTYVATFVGKPKMSLVEGTLDHHDGNVDFVGPDIRIGLGAPGSIGLRDGEYARVALGVRAEDVRIQLNGAADTARTFHANVGIMEPIGSDTFVELAVGSATIVARAAPDIDVALGQPVRADVAPGRVHLFDLGSGERINA
jgi:multiple sugar transport system ATP-binding protein